MMIDEAGWIRVLGKLGSIRNFLTWHWKIPIGQGIWKNGFPPILKNPPFFFGGTSQPAQKKTGRAICPRKRDGFFVAERTTFLLLNPPPPKKKKIPRIFSPKKCGPKTSVVFFRKSLLEDPPLGGDHLQLDPVVRAGSPLVRKGSYKPRSWRHFTITMVMKTHWFT